MELWHGERASQLRESITDQSFRYCINCGNPESLITPNPPATPLDLNTIGWLILSYDPTCNLKCRSCRNEHRGPSETTRRIHEAVLSSGVLKHSLTVCMSGNGDPFASSLLWSLLTSDIECHPDMQLNLSTNGLLVTPERLRAITDTGKKIGSIHISIDAATRETYALNRGGDWYVLLKNMDSIRGYPCHRQFNLVAQANNFREMEAFIDMACDYNADAIHLSALVNWGTYTREEYLSRAVHLPSHPQYEEFKAMLTKPTFWNPKVRIAKLPIFRPGHRHDNRTVAP
jgi:MoaA/NifB/PqqE/SkfB family radical SAM enzyme